MDLNGYDSDEDFYETNEEYNTNNNSNYTILDEPEIRRRQLDQISHISSVLSLPNHQSSFLLYHYNWNVDRLQDDWFADENAVRNKVGLLLITSGNKKDDDIDDGSSCNICYEDLEFEKTRSVSCGHKFCVNCWKSYISVAINDTGVGCLSLNCPEIKCQGGVTRDLIDELASKEEREKYHKYLVRSFVEGRKKNIKWCPTPGCDKAVEFEGDTAHGYDVTCVCSGVFCWNCVEEPHRPADCELVAKWVEKNSSEAENTKWILAYTKPCPMCKRPIEKTMGCSHMVCSAPCKFQFCWLCLGPWMKHNGNYQCNKYVETNEPMDSRMRKIAQLSLKRYAHYYERWASNHKSRQKAMDDLQRVEDVDLDKLSDRVSIPKTQLEFIRQGWKQIIECRRVLKWTYAYGYYLEDDKGDKTFTAKIQLFEFLQGQAETQLERLHACAEIELSAFLNDANQGANNGDQMMIESCLDFNKYRSKLVGLTKVTGAHFEELLRALENGLSEVAMVRNIKPSKRRDPSPSYSPLPVARPLPRAQRVSIDNFSDDWSWFCDQCGLEIPGSVTNCAVCYEFELMEG